MFDQLVSVSRTGQLRGVSGDNLHDDVAVLSMVGVSLSFKCDF